MKVAVLTMFNGLSSTYSLVNVVADHLNMLLNAGIATKVLVSEDCPDEERSGVFADTRLEWVKVTNKRNGEQIRWVDYAMPSGKVHDSFFEEADLIAADLKEKLADVDVCMMHDILYQGWHLLHNVAVRKVQKELPHLRFAAFTHSLPVNPPLEVKYPFSARYESMPNTLFVYPTASGIPALSRQYHVAEGRCRVVYNSLPAIESAGSEVQEVHRQWNLLQPDILIVYPGRLSTGKRFEKVAALAGAIQRKTEKKTAVIFCDFPSMDTDGKNYKDMIRKTGQQFGLTKDAMAFTSELGFVNGFPRQAVQELFSLSNLFICPSYSESFGLTVLEAAGKGNFLVLNEAVPALEELGKKLHAYFMRWDARNFGFDTHENYHPTERAYYEEHAEQIVSLMREDRVLYAKTMARQNYNLQWIWENQLAPLLDL